MPKGLEGNTPECGEQSEISTGRLYLKVRGEAGKSEEFGFVTKK